MAGTTGGSDRPVERAALLVRDRLRRGAYPRYALVSAAALGVDVGLFLLLLRLHVPPAAAAGSGYAAGVLLHWWLSTRTVFARGLAAPGAARHRQALLFLLSALTGLGLTMGIVAAGARLGLDARAAKLIAIAASFQAVWLIRRHLVFAR